MNWHQRLIPLLLLALLLGAPLRAQEGRTEARSGEDDTPTENFRPVPSPDGCWEYRLLMQPGADGEPPAIAPVVVKAGTRKVALRLNTPWANRFGESRGVRWSPDSRRLAYSYQSGGRYHTAELYQLRAGKWVALRSPEAPETTRPLDRVQDAQARKLGVPKGTPRQRRDVDWTIRRWVNADTAELYVYSNYVVEVPKTGETEALEADFLFTLRFDARGRWKIVRTHRLSVAEARRLDTGDK